MRSLARASIGVLLTWLLQAPVSQAVGASIVEEVGGYKVLDTEKPTDARPCQMVRSYDDPKQPGASKGLLFSLLEGGNIIVTLVSTKWAWPKDPPKVRFQIDNQVHAPLTIWFTDVSGLGALFPDTLIAKLGNGKRIVMGLQDGNVDFDLGGFRPAFAALQRCNRAARPEPGARAAPPSQGTSAPKPEATTSPTDAVPSPPTMSLGEKLAVISGLVRYQNWAVATCGMPMTDGQRKTVDSLMSTLSYLPTSLQTAFDTKFAGMKASDCPSRDFLDRNLRILVSSSTDKIVADMDDPLRRQFLAIKVSAEATPEPRAAADAEPPAQPASSPATTEELRALAFIAGMMLQDGVGRCDVATTNRQRATIAEKVAALRPEMQDIDAAAREKASREPCPESGDSKALEVLQAFVDKSPEEFAADWNDQNGGGPLTGVRDMLAELRPAGKAEPARETAYLYGLVLRDVINECEIRTTAKQRTSFEAKMASLRPDLAAAEPALLKKKGTFNGCPSAERIAELETALPAFIDRSPEAFAAEMKGKVID